MPVLRHRARLVERDPDTPERRHQAKALHGIPDCAVATARPPHVQGGGGLQAASAEVFARQPGATQDENCGTRQASATFSRSAQTWLRFTTEKVGRDMKR